MDKMLLTILSPFLTKNNSHEMSANIYISPSRMLARNICNGKSTRYIVMEMLQLFDYIVFVQKDGNGTKMFCIRKYVIVRLGQ